MEAAHGGGGLGIDASTQDAAGESQGDGQGEGMTIGEVEHETEEAAQDDDGETADPAGSMEPDGVNPAPNINGQPTDDGDGMTIGEVEHETEDDAQDDERASADAEDDTRHDVSAVAAGMGAGGDDVGAEQDVEAQPLTKAEKRDLRKNRNQR
jgi:hypothetical protein